MKLVARKENSVASKYHRKVVSDALIDAWEAAEDRDDDEAVKALKAALNTLGLPYVRLPVRSTELPDRSPLLTGQPTPSEGG